MIAQFISFKVCTTLFLASTFVDLPMQSNIRRDEYSAETNPLHLLHRITAAIRAVVPSYFVLGVKINSADYVDAGSSSASGQVDLGTEGRAVGHVAEIASWGMVDFIEISGGDYENPGTHSTISASDAQHQLGVLQNLWPRPVKRSFPGLLVGRALLSKTSAPPHPRLPSSYSQVDFDLPRS